MATIDSFEQGEDIHREVELQTLGAAIDTANFLTIEVDVFHRNAQTKIGEYSVAGGTVTKEIPTIDGIISFIVPRTATANQRTGLYDYEVITTEIDVDYIDNIRKRKFTGTCFNLEKSNE